MKKGGYQILDFKGVKIDVGTASLYKGLTVYRDYINSHGKPIIVTGLNLNGAVYPNAICVEVYNGTGTQKKFTTHAHTVTMMADGKIAFVANS